MAIQNTNLPVETEYNDLELRSQVYFDGYYDIEMKVDPSVHDAVYSYFLREMGNGASAEAMTHSLMTIAYQNNVQPLDLVDQFISQDGVSVSALMAALINKTRGDTSLIGLKEPKPTNPKIARNILP